MPPPPHGMPPPGMPPPQMGTQAVQKNTAKTLSKGFMPAPGFSGGPWGPSSGSGSFDKGLYPEPRHHSFDKGPGPHPAAKGPHGTGAFTLLGLKIGNTEKEKTERVRFCRLLIPSSTAAAAIKEAV